MTKHTPDFSYLRGLKPLVFSVEDCANTANSRRDKDSRIAELEAELAAEREKVERLSDIIADLIAGGESAEQADPRLGYIELQTDRETLARAREALAATEPTISKTETVED